MALTQIDDRGLKTPIDLEDNEKIRLGTGNDLELFHDGSNSQIINNNGELKIGCDHIELRNAAQNSTRLASTSAGALQLFFANSKKLETNSTGAKVYGSLLVDGVLDISPPGNNAVLIKNPQNGIIGFGANNQSNQVIVTADGHLAVTGDSKEFRLGASSDLKLYHNGTNSYLANTTGVLFLQSDGGVQIKDTGGNELHLKTVDNGAVELYYDNVKMFETYNGGVWIPDGTFYASGADKDVAIGHNTNNYITYKNADLLITGDASNQVKIMPKSNETSAVFKPNDSVELYYNNVLKAETTSVGFNVQGVATQETTGDDVVWGRQVFRESISANATHTYTITGLSYGNATITIGLADGNYQYAAFSAILGGMMYASGNAYVANVLQNDRSGVSSISVTKNNASYVIAIQAGSNQVFGSIVLESNSYSNGSRPTLTIS